MAKTSFFITFSMRLTARCPLARASSTHTTVPNAPIPMRESTTGYRLLRYGRPGPSQKPASSPPAGWLASGPLARLALAMPSAGGAGTAAAGGDGRGGGGAEGGRAADSAGTIAAAGTAGAAPALRR